MPYTPKQKRYLLSDVSPLSGEQKQKMLDELRADPSLGEKPPTAAPPPKKKPPKPVEPAPAKLDSEGGAYNWRNHQGRPKKATA